MMLNSLALQGTAVPPTCAALFSQGSAQNYGVTPSPMVGLLLGAVQPVVMVMVGLIWRLPHGCSGLLCVLNICRLCISILFRAPVTACPFCAAESY
jgi:hypothetical protein